MSRKAIILAGGLGTRLKHLVPDLPKPMAPVCGKPFLVYILDLLAKNGFSSVILSVGYKHEQIESFFGHRYNNLEITYSVENEPLGTGGAIKKALEKSSSGEVFVINGDTYFAVDFQGMEQFHREKKAVMTMALKPMESYSRYGSVEFNENYIEQFKEKMPTSKGYINGGVYLLQTHKLPLSEWPEKFSFEQDYLEKEVARQLFAPFISKTYFIDIGVPEDFMKANVDFANITKL